MATIGILGGTFDPIHFGHLRLAEEAREAWPLDEVWFLPAQVSPFKTDQPASPAEHRFAMVQAATEDHPHFCVSDVDLQRPGPSFTAETMRQLSEDYPEHEWVLILGMDAVRGFPRWKDWRDLVRRCHVFVGSRPGEVLDFETLFPASEVRIEGKGTVCYNAAPPLLRFAAGTTLRAYRTTMLDISATDIRQHAADGKSLRYLTPGPVIHYIDRCRLFRNIISRDETSPEKGTGG